MLLKRLKKIRIITLGSKILFGVALATNLLMGILVYMHLKSADTIEKTVDDLLVIRENLSMNLRETVVHLQNRILDLPDLFESDKQAIILEKIGSEFTIGEKNSYRDRSSYKPFFNRGERRDLANGSVIVQESSPHIYVSYGELDGENNFSGKVVRLQLTPAEPKLAFQRIQEIIEVSQGEGDGEIFLKKQVNVLNNMVAEAGLQAEETRIEILQHVENITIKEQTLQSIRDQQKYFSIYMGVFILLANMLILFILIRKIIERPLSNLTSSINQIQRGEFHEIPVLKRRDQIGLLSETVRKFQKALMELHDENIRKEREKAIIDEIVETSTEMIKGLEERAIELESMSESLQNLAQTTGEQSENVSKNAEITAKNTNKVSESAVHLAAITDEIKESIVSQAKLVNGLMTDNSDSQKNMLKLNQAVQDIDSIIGLVQEITEQTQLLALNATIEAARAGAAGKGFSVVASEMKDLSRKTQQAAADVLQKVEAINCAGGLLSSNFSHIEKNLVNLDDATGTISDGVALQNEEVQAISQLVITTHENTHEVSRSIHEVSIAAKKTSELSHKVHLGADAMACQLSELMQQTTVGLNQIGMQEETVQKTKLIEPIVKATQIASSQRKNNNGEERSSLNPFIKSGSVIVSGSAA